MDRAPDLDLHSVWWVPGVDSDPHPIWLHAPSQQPLLFPGKLLNTGSVLYYERVFWISVAIKMVYCNVRRRTDVLLGWRSSMTY